MSGLCKVPLCGPAPSVENGAEEGKKRGGRHVVGMNDFEDMERRRGRSSGMRSSTGRSSVKKRGSVDDDGPEESDWEEDMDFDTKEMVELDDEDGDEESWRDLLQSEEPLSFARKDNEKQKLMRTKTLERYEDVLMRKNDTPKEQFEQWSQQRRERAKPHLLIDEKAKLQEKADRSKEMVKLFFEADGAMQMERFDESLEDGDDEEDTFNYPLMEQSIEETLNTFKALRESLTEEQKVEVEHQRDAVAVMSRQFLEDQGEMLRTARQQIKKLIPGLKSHIKKVSKELAKKQKENFDRETLLRSQSNKGQSKKKGGSVKLTAEGQAEQASFEEHVSKLKKELAVLTKHLSQVRLEQHFPRGMMWKIKVDAGDGTFIGVRDLEVGKINADFRVETGSRGESDRIRLYVKNIVATVGLLDLSIRGANTRARILGGLLTPTINRLDLDVTGGWTLELKFIQGDSKKAQSRWAEVKEKTKFELELTRRVTGLTTIRLPQSFIQQLTKYLIPRLISGIIRNILPPQLGVILSEANDEIALTGRVVAQGDMSPKVWREPIVGPTPAARQAREAIGINEEEAVMIDFMLRGPRAAACGFKQKAISLARLFKWRLRYATFRIGELEGMLNLIQADAPTEVPSGWFAQIMKYVSMLAKKPIDIKVELKRVDMDMDLSQAVYAGLDMYVSSFKAALNMARAQKSRTLAQQKLQAAEEHANTISDLMTNYVIPLVHPNLSLSLSSIAFGGIETGIGAFALRRVAANLKLPAHFILRPVIPASEDEYPIEVQAETGPRDDEYTVKIRSSDLKGEASVVLRNTKIDLFPSDGEPGAVKIQSKEIRASVLVNFLDDFFLLLNKKINNDHLKANPPPRKPRDFLYGKTGQLIEQAELVYGLSSTFEQSEEDIDHSGFVDRHPITFLPRFIVDDDYDLRFDVRELKVNLTKERNESKTSEALRLKVNSDASKAAYFQMRINMRDIFDEIL